MDALPYLMPIYQTTECQVKPQNKKEDTHEIEHWRPTHLGNYDYPINCIGTKKQTKYRNNEVISAKDYSHQNSQTHTPCPGTKKVHKDTNNSPFYS